MQLNMNVVLFQGVLLTVQGLAYLLIQHTKHPVHDMARSVDEKIPLVPQFILAYVMWYPLLAVFPLVLYSIDSAVYSQYIISIIVDIVISLAVYWFYPTSFKRPKAPEDSFSGRMLGLMYIIDYKGLNCMPSMHCSMCFIIIYYAFVCSGMMVGLQFLFAGVALLIVVSTVFIKQHVLIDVISALPLACICIGAGAMLG